MRRLTSFKAACIVSIVLAGNSAAICAREPLPDAPVLQLVASAGEATQPQNNPPPASMPGNQTAIQGGTLRASPTLTLEQAEQMALRNNPNISIAHLLALAQQQVVRETRSSQLPMVHGDLTAVDSHTNTRVTAGYLSNSSIYDRAAGGLSISQLTDPAHIVCNVLL